MTEEEYKNIIPQRDHIGLYILEDGKKKYIMPSCEETYSYKIADELVKRYKPRSILEIGWGEGWTGRRFISHKVDYTVVEPNEWIQKTIPVGVKVIKGSVYNINSDKHYDLIYEDMFNEIHKEPPNWNKFDFDRMAFFNHPEPIEDEFREELLKYGFTFMWENKECYIPILTRKQQ